MIVSTIDTVYEYIIRLSTKSMFYIQNIFSTKDPIYEEIVYEPYTYVPENTDDQNTFKTINEVLSEKSDKEETHTQVKNMVMYASSNDVPVYMNPKIELDTKIGSIPHGEMVMMLDARGDFYKIVWNTIHGWVLKEDFVDRSAHIHPKFIIGEENTHEKRNTLHVRNILGDIFGIERSKFPLQAGEYVLYKLFEKGISIEWPDIRPRTPGTWHKILKGVPKVHIGVIPKDGSIMEYVLEDGSGHVAYVEKVMSDDTISISEANYPELGTYNERIITKEEWKELKPVFINVTSGQS